MPHRSHTIAWTVAFVLVVAVGLLVIVVTVSDREKPPPKRASACPVQ